MRNAIRIGCMTLSNSKTSVSRPSTINDESRMMLAKIHSGDRFLKTVFMLPAAPFTCGQKTKTEKFSVFKNSWIRVDEHTFYN